MLALVALLSVSLSVCLFGSWGIGGGTRSVPQLLLQPNLLGKSGKGDDVPLIKYAVGLKNQWQPYVDDLEHTIEPYREHYGQTVIQCSFQFRPTSNRVCYFDIQKFGPCGIQNSYGYPKGSPCILVTLSNVENWTPQQYNASTALSDKMPQQLKEIIAKTPLSEDRIWLSCAGKTPTDQINMGPVLYYPEMGFPGYFYPYKKNPDYLQPLLMVQFEKPQKGVTINVECQTWAINLQSTFNFKLFID